MGQLINLVKPIEDMSDEELAARLFDLRHRRDVVKPAAQAHKQKAVKKEAKKQSSAAEKLLLNLTPEQLTLLMKELGQ